MGPTSPSSATLGTWPAPLLDFPPATHRNLFFGNIRPLKILSCVDSNYRHQYQEMTSSSFQILSDLHLETHPSYDFPFKQTAPNLALLGDIGQVNDDRLFIFLQKQLKSYWNVIFLLGNHEPYGTSWSTAKARTLAFRDKMQALRKSSTMGNFVFLDQGRWDVNESLTVLGCTLFSRVGPEETAEVGTRLNDFRRIQDWSVEDHNAAHESDLAWLNDQVKHISKTEPQRQVAVFTHYSPTLDARAVDPRHSASPVSSGFATDLSREECWTNTNVVFWAFGHTHFNCDFTYSVDGMRVIANQKGYSLALEAKCDLKRIYTIGRGKSSGLLM